MLSASSYAILFFYLYFLKSELDIIQPLDILDVSMQIEQNSNNDIYQIHITKHVKKKETCSYYINN